MIIIAELYPNLLNGLNPYLPMMQLYWVSYWVFYHSYF